MDVLDIIGILFLIAALLTAIGGLVGLCIPHARTHGKTTFIWMLSIGASVVFLSLLAHAVIPAIMLRSGIGGSRSVTTVPASSADPILGEIRKVGEKADRALTELGQMKPEVAKINLIQQVLTGGTQILNDIRGDLTKKAGEITSAVSGETASLRTRIDTLEGGQNDLKGKVDVLKGGLDTLDVKVSSLERTGANLTEENLKKIFREVLDEK